MKNKMKYDRNQLEEFKQTAPRNPIPAEWFYGVLDCALELQAEVERLEAELAEHSNFTYCAYCGEKFRADGANKTDCVSEHIKTCDKHPIAALLSEIERLKSEIERVKFNADQADGNRQNLIMQISDMQAKQAKRPASTEMEAAQELLEKWKGRIIRAINDDGCINDAIHTLVNARTSLTARPDSAEVEAAQAIVKLSLPYITTNNDYASDTPLSRENLRNKIQILIDAPAPLDLDAVLAQAKKQNIKLEPGDKPVLCGYYDGWNDALDDVTCIVKEITAS